jgi:hypothetical protein
MHRIPLTVGWLTLAMTRATSSRAEATARMPQSACALLTQVNECNAKRVFSLGISDVFLQQRQNVARCFIDPDWLDGKN